MSTKTQEQINELLRELKLGCVLVQQKNDGTKCLRHYYLHKSEQFITYRQTNKTLPSPTRYYTNQIDEIRVGFKTQTFNRLVQRKLLRLNDVNTINNSSLIDSKLFTCRSNVRLRYF